MSEIRLRAMTRIGELSLELEKAQGARTELLPTAGKKSKEKQLKVAGVSTSAAQRYEHLSASEEQLAPQELRRSELYQIPRPLGRPP